MRLIYSVSLTIFLTICFAEQTQARKPAVEPTMNYNISDIYTPNEKLNIKAPKFDFSKEQKIEIQRDIAKEKELYIPNELEDTTQGEKIPYALIILLITIPVGLVLGVQISTYVKKTNPLEIPDNVLQIDHSRSQKNNTDPDDHINKAS